MPPGVFGQVVAAHEAPVAHVANEFLLAGVRAAVAGKLVGAGKLFVTALPVAAERLFTWRDEGGRNVSTQDDSLPTKS